MQIWHLGGLRVHQSHRIYQFCEDHKEKSTKEDIRATGKTGEGYRPQREQESEVTQPYQHKRGEYHQDRDRRRRFLHDHGPEEHERSWEDQQKEGRDDHKRQESKRMFFLT